MCAKRSTLKWSENGKKESKMCPNYSNSHTGKRKLKSTKTMVIHMQNKSDFIHKADSWTEIVDRNERSPFFFFWLNSENFTHSKLIWFNSSLDIFTQKYWIQRSAHTRKPYFWSAFEFQIFQNRRKNTSTT